MSSSLFQLSAGQVLAAVNASLQTWTQVQTGLGASGLRTFAAEVEPHLPALEFLLPQQAATLRRVLAGEVIDPVAAVRLAASIAEASEFHNRPELDETNGAMSVTRRSARPTSRTTAPPAAGDAVPVNFSRITGGLMASLPVLFEEWYDKEEGRVTGRGEITNAGILFTDFKGFSTKTRGVPPDQVRQRLNFYFHFLSLAVSQMGGRVDKYIGDAIMAYVVGDHASNAFKAAEIGVTLQQMLGLMNEFLVMRAVNSRAMREKLEAIGKKFDELTPEEQARLIDEVDPLIFEMRVGVHTGPVLHGEIGGPGKIDLTIIGDAVNTANRMESIGKPGRVTVSKDVEAYLGDDFLLRDRGPEAAKGIGNVHAFDILGRNHEKAGLRLHGKVRTAVQGREEEVSRLEHEFLRAASSSRAGFVLVEAEAGSGKSTVAESFLLRLKKAEASVLPDFDLIIGRGSFRPQISPFDVLSESLRHRVGLRPGMTRDEREEKIRRVAAEADAGSEQQRESFAHLLGLFLEEALENPPDNVVQLRKNPSEFRSETENMLIRLLSCLSRRRPVLLMFDDMQWIDDASLRFLQKALKELRDRPVMMLGLTRPGREVDTIGWFQGPFSAARIALDTLPQDDLRRIVRDILGEDVEESQVASILARSAGSPLFAQEIAFALKVGKPIEQVPGTIEGLFQAQLGELDEGSFDALKASALIGREFREEDLEGMGIVRPRAFLARLVDANVIVAREGGEGAYLFRHDLMLETVRGMVEGDEKKKLHLAYARHLSRKGTAENALVANHFQQGEDFESAAAHFLLAAKDASQNGAYAEAAAFAKSAFGETRNSERKTAALLEWSDALFYSAKYKDQLLLFPFFEAAIVGVDDRETVTRIRIHKAQALQNTNDHEAAEAELKLALAAYGEGEGSPFKCRVLNLLGNIHSQNKHDHASAEAYYREALETARKLGDLYYTGMALVNLSHIRLTQGDYSGGLEAATSGIEAFERAGDIKGQLFAANNAGSALVAVGEYTEAVAVYERGISLSRSKMNNFLLLSLLPSFAQPAWKSGERAKAIKAIDEAISLFGATQSYSFMRGVAHYCRSVFSAELGDVQKALAEAQEALVVAGKTNDRRKNIEAMAHMATAKAHLAAKNRDKALAASTAAMAILDQVGSIQDYDIAILSTHLEVLMQMDRTEKAREVAERAKIILDRRSEAIADPRHKASFLKDVEENRLITLHWTALSQAAK